MKITARTFYKWFLPPIETARHYNLTKLRRDVVAGLTVSVVELPQAMAYALIAGVPPQYGIYTSVIQGILGALFSSSNHMATGPTNTQSLLVASAVTRVASLGSGEYVALVVMLTMMKGLIQLAFAAARMGHMVRYMSRSVIVGLAAGAGVLIAVGQVPALLGVDVSQDVRRWPGVIGAIDRLMAHVNEINWHAVGMGVGVLVLMLLIRSINRLLPGALVGVEVSAGAVVMLGWDKGQLPLVPELSASFPSFAMPAVSWTMIESLMGGALALALVWMLETVSISKTIASKTGERINANQEFFAQGFGNFVSSFFGCIPGSGSFTRSALDYDAGGATRFAAVFNALFVAGIFLLFAAQARFIPLASLAAILLVIAWGLVDWRYFRRLAMANRSDAAVCVATFVATLVAPLEYAIFIGIFLNLALYLRLASRLHLSQVIQKGGAFIERPIHDRAGEKQVLFLQVEGDLFFGVADEFQQHLTKVLNSGVRVVILRLKRTHSLDTTVLNVLEEFTRDMQKRGGHVILCGLKPELLTRIKRYGLFDVVGKQNVFEAGFGVFTSAKRAIERARQIIGSSIDIEGLDVAHDEDDAPATEPPTDKGAYQI